MKSVLTALLLSISLIFSSGMTSYAQDFQKGFRAAQSRDFATALKEWTPLAEQGDATAQYNLGLLYHEGRNGITRDYKEAVKWWLKAAEQDHTEAQYNVGLMYERGRGIVQDYKEAVYWYRKAAEQGDAAAQYSLGYAYDFGDGVARDYVYAFMWLNLAASNGYLDAEEHKRGLKWEMTPLQLAEAQKLTFECVAKEYKGC